MLFTSITFGVTFKSEPKNCFVFQKVVHMDARAYSCSMVNPALPNDPPKSFTFDGVYAEDSTTEQIYNDIGFALVEVIFINVILL